MLVSPARFSNRTFDPLAPGTLGSFLSTVIFILVLSLLPRVAGSQGLIQGTSGYLELNYSFITTKFTDAAGNTIETKTNNYNPKFNLMIDTNIFPNLKLRAGGLLDVNKSDFELEGLTTKTTVTKFIPTLDLILSSPLYTIDLGYYRREEWLVTRGIPSQNIVNEEYNTFLEWKPDGLPYVSSRLTKRKLFDEERALLDIKEDYAQLVSNYTYKGLRLDYYGTYDHRQNDLIDLDTVDWIHNGKINYANNFFDNRLYFYGYYNIAHQEVRTHTEGQGFVTFQSFPSAGVSSIDDTPLEGALSANPALIDGNLTASAGINIGLPPLGGDTKPRNMGLDFLNVEEVNLLYVWVDRELPENISKPFTWDIYTSSDNLNWTFYRTVSAAPFGQFEKRFEIDFPTVKTRYLKVVTKPLSPTVVDASKYPNIFITELQAFVKKPASEVKGKIRRTAQTLNLSTKALILTYPSLFYEMFYDYNRIDPSGQYRYTLSNGFSVAHRFNKVFSGTARAAWETGKEEDEKVNTITYYAALLADPLKTLHSSLVFSGRNQETDGKPDNNNSVAIYNTAQLYQGIDVTLNGGVSFSKRETGESIQDITINPGANITPHPTLNLTFYYTYTRTKFSGGEKEDSSTYRHNLNLNASYNPVRTVYLTGLLQIVSEKDKKTDVLQNYGVNWSPLPDGKLQFNVSYNEELRTIEEGKDRIFTPSIRWNITKKSFLDLSYQMIRSKTNVQKTETDAYNASLKLYF